MTFALASFQFPPMNLLEDRFAATVLALLHVVRLGIQALPVCGGRRGSRPARGARSAGKIFAALLLFGPEATASSATCTHWVIMPVSAALWPLHAQCDQGGPWDRPAHFFEWLVLLECSGSS